jgi:hypothetical protein
MRDVLTEAALREAVIAAARKLETRFKKLPLTEAEWVRQMARENAAYDALVAAVDALDSFERGGRA